MAGTREHEGNRNYFGPGNVELARGHRIRAALSRIAQVRRVSPALQRGLQVILELRGNRAAFLRVYERGTEAETALVLLNKGDSPAQFEIDDSAAAGAWRDTMSGSTLTAAHGEPLLLDVPAHGVRVLIRNERVQDDGLRRRLDRAMSALGDRSGR